MPGLIFSIPFVIVNPLIRLLQRGKFFQKKKKKNNRSDHYFLTLTKFHTYAHSINAKLLELLNRFQYLFILHTDKILFSDNIKKILKEYFKQYFQYYC